MRTKLLVLLFCWVGMVGIKSGNACGKDKDENAVVLPVYERNGRMYVEIFGAGMDGIGPDRQRIGNSGEVIGE